MRTSPAISDRQLNRATLARQLLLDRKAMPVVKAIERVLALQAQVPRPPHIGLWSRLPDFDREHLLAPLRARTLVRATSMRGTLHIMSAKDFLAFRGALQESLAAAVRPVVGKVPLPPVEALIAAARQILRREPLTFNDIRAGLVKRFPGSHDRLMGYTVRMHLPLVQVPTADDPWGFPSDAAFAPADTWIRKAVGQGDRASTLVMRYLAAFGPASSADIQAWTGLRGVAEIVKPVRSKLVTFTDARGRELYDLPGAPRPDADVDAPVRFLPEYDSVVVGHAERSRLVDERYRKALVTKNLIVPPTFLVDGRIAGTWKMERKKAVAALQLAPFAPLGKAARRELEVEGERLARFVEPDAREFVVR